MSEEKIQVVGERDVWLIGAALVMVALSMALQVVNVVLLSRDSAQLRQDATIALETHHGVCVYRQTLQDQVRQTDEFLSSHPNGIPGIPASTFRSGEAKQRAAIEALSDLQCPKEAR